MKANNSSLTEDVIVELGEDSVTECFIHDLPTDSLIASFSGTFAKVNMGGAEIISGKTAIDYGETVCLELEGGDGIKKHHYIKIKGYNGIPRIDIETEDYKPVDSREQYVDAKIRIYNSPEYGVVDTLCKIRGRGHSSWTAISKHSFKVKLINKKSVLGLVEDKEYCLMAESWDKSFMRWGYMFELSKALGMSYTPAYKHVELYLNHEYAGIYLLTEQIERSSRKVITDKDGFIIERDSYYYTEPLYFISNIIGEPFSFKYPDAGDGQIADGDINFLFITSFFDEMELALRQIDEGSKEYLKFVDINSFAKWYKAEELLGNIDPNKYFVLRNKFSKLEMGPVWDADWSMGEASMINGYWEKPPYKPTIDEVVCNVSYLQFLLKDDDFCDIIRYEWNQFKLHIENVQERMSEEAEAIKYAQIGNFDRWPVLNAYLGCGLIALGTWEAEVDYVHNYFQERTKWFDQYVKSLGKTN